MNNIIRFIVYIGILVGILSVLLFVYQPGFSGPMLFDDRANLQSAKLNALTWASLLDVATHNYSGIFGRGLSSLSFGLTHYFHGEGTFYFKYHNFLIHCLTALALFYLGYRLLLITQYAKKALLIASISALIWAIHPLHVSTVLYIVQRMTQLSALFTVCALICYVIGRIRIEEGRRFGVLVIAVGYPIFLVLGLLSKENAALCTLYTLIIEGFFLASSSVGRQGDLCAVDETKRAAKLRHQYRWLIRSCFIIVPLVIGSLGLLYKLDSFVAGYESRPFSLYERLLSQIHILFYYLQLIVFPRLSEYSLYHDDYPIVREFGWGTLVQLSAIVVAIGTCILSIVKKKTNVILFGTAWFLVSHAMESTIIPLEMIFEHRNYLALYGITLILSIFLVSTLPNFVHSRGFSYGVVGAICMLLLFVLSVRVNTWRTAEKLTLVNVTAHPLSARSHTDRANLLGRYGNGEGMIEHLTIAYELQRWNPGAAIHRLSAACVFDRLDKYIIEDAVGAANGAYLTAYTSLAMDNLIKNIELGRCVINKQDVFSLLESLDFGVKGASQRNQARKHFFLARYYQHLGEIENAIDAYDFAIAGDKSMIAYPSYKIRFLIGIGMYESAESDILLLIERDKVSVRDEADRIQSLFSLLYSSKYEKANQKNTN